MQQDLLTLVENIHPILRRLHPRVQRALGLRMETVVLDANVVFRDLRVAHRRGQPTKLAEAMKAGYFRVFAPVQLQNEVEEHLPKLESKWGLAEGSLMELWQADYVPLISWIDAKPSPRRPLVTDLQRRDPKDTPYIEVYEHVGAAAVLTADNDMRDLGVAPEDWFQFVVAHREEFQSRAYVATVYFGTTCFALGTHALAAVTVKAAMSLLRQLTLRFLRLPILVQIVIVLGLGVILANPRNRARLSETFHRAVENVSRGLLPLGEATVQILNYVQYHQHLADEARQRKGLPEIGSSHPVFARDFVVRVLVETLIPLSTAEITRRMVDMGYESRSEHPERYVGRVLSEHASIRHVPGGGWELTKGLNHDPIP